MAAYKTPDFNERAALARDAKQRALEQLKAKPAPDPAVVAARLEAQAAKEQAAADARAAKIAAREEEKAAKLAAAEAAAEAAAAERRKAVVTPPTAAEMKAARDARYAARKNRKK